MKEITLGPEWRRIEEVDELETLGPVPLDGDVLVEWSKNDAASDLLELIGMMSGPTEKEQIASLILAGRVTSAFVHVNGRRRRHADLWLTVIEEDNEESILVRRQVFLTPNTLVLVEVLESEKKKGNG